MWWTAALTAASQAKASSGGGGGGGGPASSGGDNVNKGIRFGVSGNDGERMLTTGIVMAGVVLVVIAARRK